MKGLILIVLLALLGLSVYNWMQIRSLQQEIARLDTRIQQQASGGVTDMVMLQAMRALDQAKAALSSSRVEDARTAFQNAQQKLAEATRTAGDKAAPSVKWLQEQAAALGKQVDERIHGSH